MQYSASTQSRCSRSSQSTPLEEPPSSSAVSARIRSRSGRLPSNFIRLKKEGYLPDRDLILGRTADEEGGSSKGVDWLLREHRDWVDAEYCINLDGGEFEKDK